MELNDSNATEEDFYGASTGVNYTLRMLQACPVTPAIIAKPAQIILCRLVLCHNVLVKL